jgi:hypothetical protein
MSGPGRPKKSIALISQSRKVHEAEIEPDEPQRRFPLARTPEAREAQLASLAYDVVEDRIRNGSASSQELVHFLKVGSTLQKQELQKLKQETFLVEAKVKDLANVEEMKKLYVEAMDAMRGYAGQSTEDEDDTNIF